MRQRQRRRGRRLCVFLFLLFSRGNVFSFELSFWGRESSGGAPASSTPSFSLSRPSTSNPFFLSLLSITSSSPRSSSVCADRGGVEQLSASAPSPSGDLERARTRPPNVRRVLLAEELPTSSQLSSWSASFGVQMTTDEGTCLEFFEDSRRQLDVMDTLSGEESHGKGDRPLDALPLI